MQTFIYLEIEFPKHSDILEKPLQVELTASGESGTEKVIFTYMATRADDCESKRWYLSYVAESNFSQGSYLFSSGAPIEFLVHQRAANEMYSREEFFRTKRPDKKTAQPTIQIRREFSANVKISAGFDSRIPECYLKVQAVPTKETTQQAVSIRETEPGLNSCVESEENSRAEDYLID